MLPSESNGYTAESVGKTANDSAVRDTGTRAEMTQGDLV